MIEFKYDTQLLIEGENLKKEEISKHINKNLKGDCLIVVQVGNLVKIHFHTNEPWFLLQYRCRRHGPPEPWIKRIRIMEPPLLGAFLMSRFLISFPSLPSELPGML